MIILTYAIAVRIFTKSGYKFSNVGEPIPFILMADGLLFLSLIMLSFMPRP